MFSCSALEGSGANFKKGRRADPGALGERESLDCQIGPKFKLCTRSKSDTQLDLPINNNLAPIQFAKTATDQQSAVYSQFATMSHDRAKVTRHRIGR